MHHNSLNFKKQTNKQTKEKKTKEEKEKEEERQRQTQAQHTTTTTTNNDKNNPHNYTNIDTYIHTQKCPTKSQHTPPQYRYSQSP